MGLLFCRGEYCTGVTLYAEMTSSVLGQNWANIKDMSTVQKSELTSLADYFENEI